MTSKIKSGVFDSIIYFLLICLAVITLIPFLQVITVSLSPSEVNSSFGLHLLPDFKKITMEGYRAVLEYKQVWQGYWMTIMRSVLGLAFAMVLYVLGAYPLSKKYFPHRRFWTFFVVFTMYFSGGLIPTYILVKNLGMLNSMAALVIPMGVNGFTLIILRNFFMAIPDELEESARVEGASSLRILVQIILPLSKPVLATVALWTVVYHWNEWFQCMIYIQDNSKWVLQYILRKILLEGQVEAMESDVVQTVSIDSMKMATLVVSTIPIMAVYPFLQKYFVKGILVGSVKG